MALCHQRLKILLLYCLLFFCASWCVAQDYDYIQYTIKDGLPTNYVYGAIEDSDGNVWIYTENGISKFDGYTFENYGIEDGLPGNDIVYALKDNKGRIWFQAFNGHPSCLVNDSIVTYPVGRAANISLINGNILYQLYSSQSWSMRNDSAHLFKVSQVDSSIYNRYRHKIIRDTIVKIDDHKNMLAPLNFLYDYVLCSKQYYYYFSMPENFMLKKFVNGYLLIDGKRNMVYLNQNGHLDSLHLAQSYWLNLNNSLIQIGEKKFCLALNRRTVSILNFQTKLIQSISVDQHLNSQHDDLVVSRLDSSFFLQGQRENSPLMEYDYDGNMIAEYHCDRLINGYYMLRPYRDSRGNLWIGSREGGLFFIPAAKRATQRLSSSLPSDRVFEEILESHNGQIFGITDNVGIYQIHPNGLEMINSPHSEFRHRSSVATPQGIAISLSNSMLLLNDNNKLITFSFRDPNTNRQEVNLQHLTYDKSTNSIFGVYKNHRDIIKISLLKDNYLEKQIKLNMGNVLCYNDSLEDLVVINNDSIFLYNSSTSVVTLPDSIHNISAMYSEGNKIWLGTKTQGLYCYNTQLSSFTKLSSLKFIKRIGPDTDTSLLAATYEGVLVFPKEIKSAISARVYTVKDGLSTNEIQDVHFDGIKYIYAATSDGLHKIDRTYNVRTKPIKDDLKIKFFTANGISPVDSDAIDLSYDQNEINIEFHLQSYASNGNVRYYTKLEPIEDSWQQSSERSITYRSLPSNEYTFLLKAADIYGNTVEHDPIHFTVNKPYWKTVGFIVVSSLLLLIVIIGFIKRREGIQKLRHENKQRLTARISELELSALKAQMNPHFIFNALGAIQYYIQVNEVDKADEYLTKFGLLMRMYLDGSKQKFVALKEEIRLLNIYLTLEKMRFEEKFTFSIEVDQTLRADDLYIPTMIVQPFVENAINHGLIHRTDENGRLNIRFLDSGSNILIIVADNGIGREKSRSFKNPNHKSQGLNILNEKIQILNNSGLADILINITDLEVNNSEYPGTMVTLTIKKMEDED